MEEMTAYTFACAVARFLDDNKAQNIKILNISSVSSFADYFVIASSDTSTQIKALTQNTAEAIKKIIEAKPDAAYLTLQGFEALKTLASSESTKIVIPSELQNVTSLLTSMKEVVGEKETKKKYLNMI